MRASRQVGGFLTPQTDPSPSIGSFNFRWRPFDSGELGTCSASIGSDQLLYGAMLDYSLGQGRSLKLGVSQVHWGRDIATGVTGGLRIAF